VVLRGGLVGAELVGELTAFADDLLRFYPRIRRDELCFRLFEAGPRVLPEVDSKLPRPRVEKFSGTTARPLTDSLRGACE